jgi:hypothetical protein
MSHKRTPFVLVVSGVLISLSAFSQEKSLNKNESTARATAGLPQEHDEQPDSGADDENSAIDEGPGTESRREGPVRPHKQTRCVHGSVGYARASLQEQPKSAEPK